MSSRSTKGFAAIRRPMRFLPSLTSLPLVFFWPAPLNRELRRSRRQPEPDPLRIPLVRRTAREDRTVEGTRVTDRWLVRRVHSPACRTRRQGRPVAGSRAMERAAPQRVLAARAASKARSNRLVCCARRTLASVACAVTVRNRFNSVPRHPAARKFWLVRSRVAARASPATAATSTRLPASTVKPMALASPRSWAHPGHARPHSSTRAQGRPPTQPSPSELARSQGSRVQPFALRNESAPASVEQLAIN